VALNKHHHRALYVLLATLLAIVFMGVLTGFAHHVSTWHGIYCATGFATTAGCDLPMTSPEDFILGEVSMVLMIPLLTSAFSFLTTALLADHMEQNPPAAAVAYTEQTGVAHSGQERRPDTTEVGE